MDNSSGGGIPAQPPSPPEETPEIEGDAARDRSEASSAQPADDASERPTELEQFTVPVPAYSAPTQALPVAAPPSQTPWGAASAYPPPGGAPLVPANPYAVESVARQAPSDADSLRNLGLVLLGVVIGFWLFVVIRIVAYLLDVGPTARLLIDTIDAVSVETIGAALVSVLAVASVVASRAADRRRLGGPLLWSTAIFAIITITAAVWRVI